MKKSKKRPAGNALVERFTLRISGDANKHLHALGRIEKRHMAKMVRTCLYNALAEWHATHPGQSPLKPQAK